MRQHSIALGLLLLSLAAVADPSKLPLVITTWNFEGANDAAWHVLTQTPEASALDALVEGLSTCERLQCAGTVGYGGAPDENGETTQDAMLMDGANMNIGAVGGMRQIKDATRVARHVLEHTRHTMLVGDAATNFAEMMGFPRETLTTPTSQAKWERWRANNCQPNFWLNVQPDPKQHCGPYKPLTSIKPANEEIYSKHDFSSSNHDTVSMIVIDAEGHIYAGTSTNGARYKIPGRVGDSPIPGSGAYADNEIGAAVATGDGDVMMRFLPSLVAVEGLRNGLQPEQAAEMAVKRILRFYADFAGALLVTDRHGNYAAACAGFDRFPYKVAGGEAGNQTRLEFKDCLNKDLF